MRLALLSLWAATFASAQVDYNRVYTATFTEDYGSNVGGRVTVFVASDDTVAYVGTATGLTPSLKAINCTAVDYGKCIKSRLLSIVKFDTNDRY